MLEEGARLRLAVDGDFEQDATVLYCNSRGTVCKLQYDSGHVKTVNLNKQQYKEVEAGSQPRRSDQARAAASTAEAAECRADEPAGASGHEAAEAGEGGTQEEPGSGAEGEDEGHEGNGDVEEEEEEAEQEDGLPELDAFDAGTRDAVEAFAAAATPAALLRPSPNLAELARQAAQALYAYTASAAPAPAGTASAASEQPAQELLVDGFDAEQVWLQLEAAAPALLRRARRLLRRAGDAPSLIDADTEAALNDLLQPASSSSEDEDGGEALDAGRRNGTRDGARGDAETSEEADEGGDQGSEGEAEEGRAARKAGRPHKALPGEDRFMRLDDMEAFLQDAECNAATVDDDASPDEDGEDAARVAGDGEGGGEDEEEAALDALLDDAAQLVGGRRRRRVRFEEPAPRSGWSDEEADDGAGAMYADLFGGSGAGATPRRRQQQRSDGSDGGEEAATDEDDDAAGGAGKAAGGGAAGAALSTHERRLARMAARIARMEEANMGEREWFLRGEAGAGSRPLNSALEVDLDFERAVRPPPAPTEVATASLEDLIRRRCAERRWDDPPKVAPPAPEVKRRELELNDQKSAKGLGELYAEEYVAAKTGGAAEDKQEGVRVEARALVAALTARLDALSHFHFAPRPVVEDLTVRADVPALAMEEVAPQVVSEAAMRRAEEVFRAEAGGAAAAETELSREERRARRAKKKRAFKKRGAGEEQQRRARPAVQGGDAQTAGRKSAAADAAAEADAKVARRKARKVAKAGLIGKAPGNGARSRTDFSKSAAVFGRLQDRAEAAAAGVAAPAKVRPAAAAASSKALKM
ncbi:hypothetical protein WJX81_002321 [Elliptochloris bilobata]|uniref:Uncharacterized protein n=1 Tax=Elliptochloris bilobata TaxID=381761 RepID=A0AAW1RNN9_9CHLO